MKLQPATKEQYLKLKKIGFDLDPYFYKDEEVALYPPTVIAIKWLRENKGVYVYPELFYSNGNEDWMFVMHLAKYKPFSFNGKDFEQKMYALHNYNTYEEAEAAGLDAALDYLLNNKK